MNPEDQIRDAIQNTTLIFKRYAPWVLVALVVITMVGISGSKRR